MSLLRACYLSLLRLDEPTRKVLWPHPSRYFSKRYFMSPPPFSSLFLPKLSHCSVLEGGRQAGDRWCLGAGSPWGPGFCEPCPACRSPWVPLTTHSGALLTPPSLSCFSLLSTYLGPLQALNPPPAAIPTSRSSSISASRDQASSSFHCQPRRGFPQRVEPPSVRLLKPKSLLGLRPLFFSLHTQSFYGSYPFYLQPYFRSTHFSPSSRPPLAYSASSNHAPCCSFCSPRLFVRRQG